MRLICPDEGQNKLLGQWLQKRLGGGLIDCQCFAGLHDGEIVSVVSFFNYKWPNIEVCFVSENYRWALNRKLIAKVFEYPFKQLKCRRVTALIEKKNKIGRRMAQRLGFVEEGKLRQASENGDIVVYGLLPKDFRLKSWNDLSRQKRNISGTVKSTSLSSNKAIGMTASGH